MHLLPKKNQLFGIERDRCAGGDVLHAEIEGFTGGRKAQRRQQHDGAAVKRQPDGGNINLAGEAGLQKINAFHDSHRACGNQIARQDPNRGMRHGRVGQSLRKRSFDIKAQFAGGFFCALERHGVGDAHGVDVAALGAAQPQLFIDLRARTMHEDNSHAHRMKQPKVMGQRVKTALRKQLAWRANHERAAPERMNVGRDRAQPADETSGIEPGFGRI